MGHPKLRIACCSEMSDMPRQQQAASKVWDIKLPPMWRQDFIDKVLGMVGGTLALTQKRPEHFLLAILFTTMALRSARSLPLAALILLPVANRAITEALPASQIGR